MSGMSARSGEPLYGLEHLRQSISDILSTPIGSRIMRRNYGSRIPELIDMPASPAVTMQIYAATAEALAQWEPRFVLERVQLDALNGQGKTSITVEGQYLPDGRQISLEGIAL